MNFLNTDQNLYESSSSYSLHRLDGVKASLVLIRLRAMEIKHGVLSCNKILKFACLRFYDKYNSYGHIVSMAEKEIQVKCIRVMLLT